MPVAEPWAVKVACAASAVSIQASSPRCPARRDESDAAERDAGDDVGGSAALAAGPAAHQQEHCHHGGCGQGQDDEDRQGLRVHGDPLFLHQWTCTPYELSNGHGCSLSPVAARHAVMVERAEASKQTGDNLGDFDVVPPIRCGLCSRIPCFWHQTRDRDRRIAPRRVRDIGRAPAGLQQSMTTVSAAHGHMASSSTTAIP